MAAQTQQRWGEAHNPGWAWATMVLVGILFFPLAVAVFCLLGLGVLHHFCSAFLAGRFASFGLGGSERRWSCHPGAVRGRPSPPMMRPLHRALPCPALPCEAAA